MERGSAEDRAWDELVESARRDLFPKLVDSATYLALVPTGEPDVKFCLELGAMIMFDKPLILIGMPGATIPPRLRAIADEVLDDVDVDTEAGQEQIRDAVLRFAPGSQP